MTPQTTWVCLNYFTLHSHHFTCWLFPGQRLQSTGILQLLQQCGILVISSDIFCLEHFVHSVFLSRGVCWKVKRVNFITIACFILYLHCVSLAWWGLAICKDGPIVTFQHIWNARFIYLKKQQHCFEHCNFFPGLFKAFHSVWNNMQWMNKPLTICLAQES